MMAFASALVRVVAQHRIFLMTVAGVHRGIPVGDETVGQRGVKFSLRLLHPVAHLLGAHLLCQTRQGIFAAHALHVHDGGQGGIVGKPAHMAEALALDQCREHEAVDHLAHGCCIGAGAHHRTPFGETFDHAGVFEKPAPSDHAAVSGERSIGAGQGELARQRVQREIVRERFLGFT